MYVNNKASEISLKYTTSEVYVCNVCTIVIISISMDSEMKLDYLGSVKCSFTHLIWTIGCVTPIFVSKINGGDLKGYKRLMY